MPEPSDSDRRKAAELPAWFANTRLVQALEYQWELHFRCQFCGATRTWRRDTMLGRMRTSLNATLGAIQARARCHRCRHGQAIMTMTGLQDPGPYADAYRRQVVETLLEADLNPADYGYGWRPQAHVR